MSVNVQGATCRDGPTQTALLAHIAGQDRRRPATADRRLRRDLRSQRPHQGLDAITVPDERYAEKAIAAPADHPLDTPPRLSQVTVSSRGQISVAGNLQGHIGREFEGGTVEVARDGNHVAVFHHGRLIHSTAIDPTRRYQPSGKPAGRARRRNEEESRCSARSEARTNDLDTDEPSPTTHPAPPD